MTPVHRLGHMSRPGRPMSSIVITLDEGLVCALDEHIANRLGVEVEPETRAAVIGSALRQHLDYWPDAAPAEVRRGPAAS